MFLEILQYIIIIVLILISLPIAIEDFKEGKIRNKWIKLGFYLGLIYYAFLFLMTILGLLGFIENYLPEYYYLLVLLNTLLSFVIAYTLWHFKLWAGGDAKLFTLFVFLLPLSFYANAYFKYWPALNLAINMMLPILFYLLIKFLIYPLGLLFNYVKNPNLLKEYYQKNKKKYQIDRSKFPEYVNFILSFLLILIFFQLLRTRIGELLSPFLGNLIIAFYFFLGVVIFQPLRIFLKKHLPLVSILIGIYIAIGLIYFRELLLSEIHNLIAIQMIFMLAFFYLLKFGRIIGSFLYNSAEVKIIPLDDLTAGMYINKEYVKSLLGNRLDWGQLRTEIEPFLADEDKSKLWSIINGKFRQKKSEKIFSSLTGLSWKSLINLIISFTQIKKEKAQAEIFLQKIYNLLPSQSAHDLQLIINNSTEVQDFMANIKGRLSADQAKQLRRMIEVRNEEMRSQGQDPIDKIILHKTFSFAPFMLLGVIITIITKSSLIHLLYQLLGR